MILETLTDIAVAPVLGASFITLRKGSFWKLMEIGRGVALSRSLVLFLLLCSEIFYEFVVSFLDKALGIHHGIGLVLITTGVLFVINELFFSKVRKDMDYVELRVINLIMFIFTLFIL